MNNTELMFSIMIFIIPILVINTLMFISEYVSLNEKKKSNNSLVNHIAEDFHNVIGVKIYEDN